MSLDRRMLDIAARAALRGAGYVEPNPMVGCVIGTRDGRVLGVGHHRRFGDAHAEVEAIDDCRRRGRDPRGGVAWVTLEPCNHTGKTPPCSRALIDAGVAEVVIARVDPNPVSTGGVAALRDAGLEVRTSDDSALAVRISDPFVRRVTTGLPWVIAKWAQTIDGRIATRTGESKWISNDASRRSVHRLRAHVDVILTAIGTVRADDPRLTARDVPVRRLARRVLLDPDLELPDDAALLSTLEGPPHAPLTVVAGDHATAPRIEALRARGVEVVVRPTTGDRLPLEDVLRRLVDTHDVTTVMIEGGAGLLGSLLAADLIDEAWVYVAPMLLGDPDAYPSFTGPPAPRLADARRWTLAHARRLHDDMLLRYRRPVTST